MKEIISKLKLKCLNLDNSKLIHETQNEIEEWSCETQIENTDCKTVIIGNANAIQIYIYPSIDSNNANDLLRKVNKVNLENLGCGIVCYIDYDSETPFVELKTLILDLQLYSEDSIVEVLNDSIQFVPQIIKGLN